MLFKLNNVIIYRIKHYLNVLITYNLFFQKLVLKITYIKQMTFHLQNSINIRDIFDKSITIFYKHLTGERLIIILNISHSYSRIIPRSYFTMQGRYSDEFHLIL